MDQDRRCHRALAQIGVILLLFEVGLESNLGEMLEVGWSSLFVAIAGVVAPFFLGWGVSAYFLPNESRLVHIFIGAVLCATSVGITARVLKDIGKLKLRESRIILGAAVIDDVIGLLILATVVGAVAAAATGTTLSAVSIFLAGGESDHLFHRRLCARSLRGPAFISRCRKIGESWRPARSRNRILFLAFMAGSESGTCHDRWRLRRRAGA